MAEKNKQAEQTPEPVINDRSEKPAGILHSILVVFLALLVVAVVSFGVFYFFTKNNINGFADTIKPRIKDNPILKIALPKEPVAYDPDDPKYLTSKELLEKYDEYRNKVKDLNESLEQANKEIERMNQENLSAEDAEAMLAENKVVLDTIKHEQEELAAEKAEISKLIAIGDKDGLKQYFEKVDKTIAAEIYKEIIAQTVIDEEMVKLAKPFAGMEPKRAAGVLTELYKSDSEAALDIVEGLKADALGLILESMDSEVAAEIISKMASRKADIR